MSPADHPILLAPAGSPAAAVAALEAGADAIYVGLKGWSRGGAKGELAADELREVLAASHAQGRQVRVAINTIPRGAERRRLVQSVADLIEWAVDGVIVNDPGILAELRARYPALPIAASIGCSAMNEADVAFYRDLGAESVVLPGTLSPDELRAAAGTPGVLIEAMIHMVEEFIVLGKCWMPSFFRLNPIPLAGLGVEGSRLIGSMKRGGAGVCFKVCERPWDVYMNGQRVAQRLLPSRQLSRINELSDILDAGVDVIKLQGRSLTPGLLGPLVRRYRMAIDAWRDGGACLAFDEASLEPSWTVSRR
ncbi:MAG: peptidase U32 family protein [Candidatus Methylomirabilaceae bacterium]